MKHEEYLLLLGLFLLGIFLWTLPIQDNPLPFGEGDAAWHWANSDAAAQGDKTFWRLPEYIGFWYYNINPVLGPNALHYPPSWHVNGALFQIVGGERVVPIFIYAAIASFIGAFALYFFLRKTYGFGPAVVGALGVLLSYRSIMSYLWGQRPSITCFAFTPLILYCFYKFMDSYYKDEKRPIYWYMFILLVAVQYMMHVMASMQTFLIIIPCVIMFVIKYKRMPISKQLVKHYIVGLVILVALTAPFFWLYGAAEGDIGKNTLTFEVTQPERLLYWFDIEHIEGYPNIGGAPLTFYDTTKNYFYGYWIFVIIGILYLIYKRENKDLVMLAWVIGTYLSFHLDIFGILPFHRTSRFLLSETALFYALIGIGVFGFIRLFKSTMVRGLLTGVATALFLILFISNFNTAYETLDQAYDHPAIRITEPQYEAAIWMKENLPEDAQVYHIGTLTYPKHRFMYVLSQRFGLWYTHNVTHPWFKFSYVLVDYSDYIMLGNQEAVDQLGAWEKELVGRGAVPYNEEWYVLGGIDPTPIYNKNNIHIYKVQHEI